MSKMPPCKLNGILCSKRQFGCRAHCPDYAAWEAEHRAERDARFRANFLFMNDSRRRAYNKKFGQI